MKAKIKELINLSLKLRSDGIYTRKYYEKYYSDLKPYQIEDEYRMMFLTD